MKPAALKRFSRVSQPLSVEATPFKPTTPFKPHEACGAKKILTRQPTPFKPTNPFKPSNPFKNQRSMYVSVKKTNVLYAILTGSGRFATINKFLFHPRPPARPAATRGQSPPGGYQGMAQLLNNNAYAAAREIIRIRTYRYA